MIMIMIRISMKTIKKYFIKATLILILLLSYSKFCYAGFVVSKEDEKTDTDGFSTGVYRLTLEKKISEAEAEDDIAFIIRNFSRYHMVKWLTILEAVTFLTPNARKIVFRALQKSESIIEVEFYNLKLDIETIVELANALGDNIVVTTLGFFGAVIDDDGICIIAKLLEKSRIIRVLNFANTVIREPGIMALAGAIGVNLVLETLNFAYTGIGDFGIKMLAPALKANKTVTTLNIAHIGIGDEGAVIMGEVLERNATLTTLHIEENNAISERGYLHLLNALNANTTLTNLHIGIVRSDIFLNIVTTLLETNITITELVLGAVPSQIPTVAIVCRLATSIKEVYIARNTLITTLIHALLQKTNISFTELRQLMLSLVKDQQNRSTNEAKAKLMQLVNGDTELEATIIRIIDLQEDIELYLQQLMTVPTDLELPVPTNHNEITVAAIHNPAQRWGGGTFYGMFNGVPSNFFFST